MAIEFSEARKTLHIRGKSFSYVIHIDENGRLLNLYWGKKLPESNIEYVLDSYHAGASFDLKANRLPYELPTRGAGWYGLPAVGAVNENGDDVVDLIYVSHEIRKGKTALAGLPSTYAESPDEATELEIVLKDALTGLYVRAFFCVFEELDALTRSLLIENRGLKPVTLTQTLSASVPLFGDSYEVIHLKGAWARERSVVREPISQGTMRVESQRGASGHEENPFIALVSPDTGESGGEARALALVYSGSFLAQTSVDNFGSARVAIGLNPDMCIWKLDPGERFQTPEAILVYSREGLGGMSSRFHKLIRTRLCRGYWRDRPRPVLINNWEATYFDFTPEKLLAIAERARDIGVELFVLDDGWFGKRNMDNSSLGDWIVNTDKLPGGIGALAERINSLGLMFGLWFEPEMVSPDSDLYRTHPDWCLHVDGRARTQSRQQLILDLSRGEVQDYIIESVSAVLSGANIGYVKWDMNRNMTEYFSDALPPERRRETQHRYMLGLYRVLETITARFPKVLFESCSGGGGRFDSGMLHYMPQTWTSDDTDPIERLRIQYGTSMVYPVSAMGAHVSASPNHQTGRVSSMKTRGNVALGGNFGFELDLSALSEDDIATAREFVSTVKSIRDITQRGEFLRLSSPFEDNVTAWQFISEDARRAILCVYRRLAEPNPTARRVFMRGLDENARYRDEASGAEYTGAALMYVGIPLVPGADFSSERHVFSVVD